jgi:hypothetical protein
MTFIKYPQYRNIGKPNYLTVFGRNKPKSLNRIANIGYGHLCLREENLSFNNNYNATHVENHVDMSYSVASHEREIKEGTDFIYFLFLVF